MQKSARTLLAALACSASLLVVTAPASAQVVIMRKMMPFKPGPQPVFEGPVTSQPGETTPVNPNAYYSWSVSPWEQLGVCGSQGLQTRSVNCKRTDGTVVPDSRCVGNGSGPRPIASQPVTITATCGYQWEAGEWQDRGAYCGQESQVRDVVCRRSDGAAVDVALCSGRRPEDGRTVLDVSACTYRWGAEAWTPPTNQCGASTQTRKVFCQRSDGDRVEDAQCSAAGEAPPSTQEAYVTSGCAANWKPSNWGKAAPACGTSSQSRDVPCVRADGVTVADDQCTLEKPATSQPVKDYSTCIDGRTPENPFGWSVGSYGPLSTTCGEAVRTRTVACTDDDGNQVADAKCVLAKPETTLKSHETSSCTLSWQIGEYGPIQPACGATVKTRSVVCMRSDGEKQADTSCSLPKPASTEPYTDYSACTFGWSVGTWSSWSSTCGAGVQTRTVACQRSDGTPSPEATCTQSKPEATQSGYQTTGCTFGWQTGPWENAPACGDVAQTRRVQCVRSDGEVIDDATCSAIAAKPASSQTVKDYGGCSYTWSVGSYGPWSTTCGAATSTRTVTCQRSNGEAVSDTFCANAGDKPASSQRSDQSSTCTYSWKPDVWGTPVSACGPSTQNRTVTCTRSDNSVADPALCTAVKPATSQPVNDYSSCNYSWSVSTWSTGALCGESAIQKRTVTCSRSDGQSTTDANCIIYGAGPKPASSQPVTDYTGCEYSWRVSYGTWSSTCSDAAVRNNVVTCQRSDGGVADPSMCPGTAPSAQDVQGIYTSCTYAATYSAEYGSCTPTTANSDTGIQTAPITSCVRSDGKTVATSSCNPQQKSQSCIINSGARYVREVGRLDDPNYYSATAYSNQDASASSVKFVVVNTYCWDYSTNKAVSDTFCSSLPRGANVTDLITLPAAFVPDLREVWVSPADVTAAAPHGYSFFGNSMSTFCNGTSGFGLFVGPKATGATWTLRCGTPDSAGHYVRSPTRLDDPFEFMPTTAAKYVNSSFSGTSYKLGVRSTTCWDTIGNKVVSDQKCQYLPTGANVYDLVSLPATYVQELREVWVAREDLTAALGYGNSIGGNSLSTVCSGGMGVRIGNASNLQTWTLRCGAPERPDRYVRSPSRLDDPYQVSGAGSLGTSNNSVSATSVRLMVQNTLCYDTVGKKQAGDLKCQYLSTGANVYDLVSLPATFEKDLREITVSQADLQTALGYGTSVFGNNISTACAGNQGFYLALPSGGQQWRFRCGVPDTADHYQRHASVLRDATDSPSMENRLLNSSVSANKLWFVVSGTICRDTRANANVTEVKCYYLPSGSNTNDMVSVPATFVKDLREVWVNQSDLQAVLPYGGSIMGDTIATVCTGRRATSVNVGGTWQSWTVRCGTPDTADHYENIVVRFADPMNWSSGANRTINDTASGRLAMAAREIQCRDTRTGSSVAGKCDYLPDTLKLYDTRSVPATFDTTAKTVTVNLADIKALTPYTGSILYNDYVCNRAFYVTNGAAGNYTVICK